MNRKKAKYRAKYICPATGKKLVHCHEGFWQILSKKNKVIKDKLNMLEATNLFLK